MNNNSSSSDDDVADTRLLGSGVVAGTSLATSPLQDPSSGGATSQACLPGPPGSSSGWLGKY